MEPIATSPATEKPNPANDAAPPQPVAGRVREELEQGKLQRENAKLESETEKLDQEKATLKAQAKNLELQRLQIKNQYFRERLRALLDISLALLAVFIAMVLLHEIWSAWHDKTVVVSPFQVAPAFVTEGNSGTVLAGQLLDNLNALQAATRASQEKRRVKDAWSNQLQIQIPEARITIADLQKYLRDLLGNPVHIDGSLVQGQDKQGKPTIALTVRGTGIPAKTFTGAPDELSQMMQGAAEYVYGKSEPYLFGVYLAVHGRMDEAVAVAKENLATALLTDKPLLLNLWGNYLLEKNDPHGAIEKFRQAIALQPNFWIAYVNIQAAQSAMGEEEAAFQTGLEFERRAHRGSWWYAMLPDRYYPKPNPAWWMNVDESKMDFAQGHAEKQEDIRINGPGGTTTTPEAPADAQDLTSMHDPQAAELELETSPGADSDPWVITQSLYVRALIALDMEQYAESTAKFQAMDAFIKTHPDVSADFTGYSCPQALADEFSGHPEQADADIVRGGRLVDCYRMKANIDDHRGQWPKAQQDYAAGVALAPSLPVAYEDWGKALARHGDYDHAIEKFAAAHERGPHWADPLEYWGEALAAEGQQKDAIKKYKEAAKYAPNWGALYLHWGIALEKSGRQSEALEKWHLAQSLALSDGNKAELARVMAAASGR